MENYMMSINATMAANIMVNKERKAAEAAFFGVMKDIEGMIEAAAHEGKKSISFNLKGEILKKIVINALKENGYDAEEIIKGILYIGWTSDYIDAIK